MILNTRIWTETVNAAKAAASSSPQWLRAIDRAVVEIEKARYWAFDGSTLTIQSTTSKKMYRVSPGAHTCEARGGVCKHRACLRLMQRYTERLSASPVRPAREAGERQTLIADINATWSRRFPGESLADNLMARFRVNALSLLNTDFLCRVLAAIA